MPRRTCCGYEMTLNDEGRYLWCEICESEEWLDTPATPDTPDIPSVKALLHISQAQIDRARKAFQAYVAWKMAHPFATVSEIMGAMWVCAHEAGLDSEGKIYYSVLVNESNSAPPISGRRDDAR